MNTKSKVLHTLVLPFLILISLIQIKEIWGDYKDDFNRLKGGKYTSDTIYPPSPIKGVRAINSKYWRSCGELRERYKGKDNSTK